MYAVYALLFADHGMSVGQISSLFVVWSSISFLLEVPSGAWADTVSRRGLLVASAGIYAACFAAWTVAPSYAGFATGFVLWGVSGALMSGTFEALLYDELDAVDASASYAALMGSAHSLAMGCNLVATVAAAPLLAVGGYPAVGWTSVGVALLQGAMALLLPSTPRVARADDEGPASGGVGARYLRMLRAGVTEVHRRPVVRHGVLLASLLVGLTVYDEFFPLLATEQGSAPGVVPLLLGLTVLGQMAGTALAGRTVRQSSTVVAGLVAAAAALLVVGVLAGGWGGGWGGGEAGGWVGFALIGAGYGLASNAMVVSEARLQDAVEGPARATVISVYGLLSEVVALVGFGLFALGTVWWSISTTLVLLVLPAAAIALLVPRWLPPRRDVIPAAADEPRPV
jgi:MFS family permease